MSDGTTTGHVASLAMKTTGGGHVLEVGTCERGGGLIFKDKGWLANRGPLSLS